MIACVLTSFATLISTSADVIEGGTTRDSNLFHSFLEFNIRDAERVYFLSSAGVESIISRVTGRRRQIRCARRFGEDGFITVFEPNQQGNILLKNGASIDVRLATAGDVQLVGGHIDLLSSSQIEGEIESGFGQAGSQAGDIRLDARGAIAIDDAFIGNVVGNDAIGNAGDIQIDAGEVG